MSENGKKSIFERHLHEDEYIIWEGRVSSLINLMHPLRYIKLIGAYLQYLWYFIRKYMYYILVPLAIIFGIGMCIYMFTTGISSLKLDVTLLVFLLIAVGVQIIPRLTRIRVNMSVDALMSEPSDFIAPQFLHPWTRNQYVITNKRVLLYEDGDFQEISLILMQDAVKTKPKSGKSTINLYNNRSATGEIPTPIATMNNLSEKDAEDAYDLLVKARDLSFEERIEDMKLN